MRSGRPVFLALLLALTAAAAEPRWEIRFFHDEDQSEYYINDLKFPSPLRGIACGYLLEKGRIEPRVLVTGDGGQSWSFVAAKRVGLSLFFLNDSLGWMVSDDAVWRTEESGLSWERIASLKHAEMVYFVSETRGWAVGPQKSIYETSDGGRTWVELPIADEPNTRAENTAYGWIEFDGSSTGSITGWSRPRRALPSRLPDWMDPEGAERRRQWPTLSILLRTTDGGRTWESSTVSMFGRIIRLRLRPDGKALAVVSFDDGFDWPSEVYLLDNLSGAGERSFRASNRAVTDALLVGEEGYLAAVDVPGKLPQTLLPGRLVIYHSNDLRQWTEMPVDYRAFARRAMLAAADEKNVWVATDTGIILQLR